MCIIVKTVMFNKTDSKFIGVKDIDRADLT